MNSEEKFSSKGRGGNGGDKVAGGSGGRGRGGTGGGSKARGGSKSGKVKANAGEKVRLQEYLDSLIELHKLQHVLLRQMDKEI